MISINRKYGHRYTLNIYGVTLPWPFPIASMLGSSSAIVFGWPVYGAKAPSYIKSAFKIFYKLQRANHWLLYRLHPAHRYHIVKTDLKPGYYDVDTIMLHSCMTLLCRYVEQECGGVAELEKWTEDLRKPGSEGYGPRNCVDEQVDIQSSALAIYHWWKIDKPNDEVRRDDLTTKLYSNRIVSQVATNHPDLYEIKIEFLNPNLREMETEFKALEQKISDDEQKMLHQLVNIRQGLWT